jgi:hypothetical protein
MVTTIRDMRLISHRFAVGLALLGLVAANLLLDVWLVWLMEEWFRGSWWFDQIPIGLLLSQLALLAFWLGLGDGRWYVRPLLAIPLTMCLAKSISIAMQLAPRARREADPSPTLFFILLAMLLATSSVAFALRRMRGWRWTWKPVVFAAASGQFQINDVLLVMIVLGGALAAVRFLITIDSDFPSQILDISLYAVKTMAVALGAMLLAYSKRHRVRGAVLLMLAVLLIGAVFAIPDAYKSVPRVQIGVGTTSAPVWTYAVAWWKESLKQEAFVVGAAICGLVNSLALRALGGKLVRPDSGMATLAD